MESYDGDIVALGGATFAVLLAGAALWQAWSAREEAKKSRKEMDWRLRSLDILVRQSPRSTSAAPYPTLAIPPTSSGTGQTLGEPRGPAGLAPEPATPVYASSAAPIEPPPVAPPILKVLVHRPVDGARAREIFDLWCGLGRGPEPLEDVEIVAMSFNSSELDSIGKVLRHLLRESPQVSHFVRIGAPGASQAYLFPHPDAAFSPFIQSVFRGVTADTFKSPGLLAGTRPLTVRRIEGQAGAWEVPCQD